MPHTPGPQDLPNGVSKRKVLFIDLDGVRYDKLLEADTPIIDALGRHGPVRSVVPARQRRSPATNSGPGHSTMLTGVWPDKHQVLDNSFGSNDLVEYPDVFTRLETADRQLSTFTTARLDAAEPVPVRGARREDAADRCQHPDHRPGRARRLPSRH